MSFYLFVKIVVRSVVYLAWTIEAIAGNAWGEAE
jgi:hypothetical protein